MANLEEYQNKYETVKFERSNGILQITFHTNGGSLDWGGPAHREFGHAFADIGCDPENRVVILTGAGDNYCAEFGGPRPQRTPRIWEAIYWEGRRLLNNLLDIDVPIIAAVNGPALIHAEIPVLSDIVLASETATFQDAPHFAGNLVPADGVHIVWPLLLGPNRGRYFLLTGQTLSAQEALDLGVVAEVLPKEKLLPRAWQMAEQLAQQPDLILRHTRIALTLNLKRQMQDMLGYGLALEGLAAIDLKRS